MEIECDRLNNYKYSIKYEGEIGDDTVKGWMLSTLSVNNALSGSRAVYDRILLDPIPADGENLFKRSMADMSFMDDMLRGIMQMGYEASMIEHCEFRDREDY